MTWHEIKNPNSPDLDALAAQFGLHPLHVEDCRSPNERPKAECGDHYLFLLLNTLSLSKETEVEYAPLCLFAGHDFLVTVCDESRSGGNGLGRARRANENTPPGKLAYIIFDEIVDTYFGIIDRFDDHIDTLQDEVLSSPTARLVEEIFGHKRELAELRRILVNTRDVCLFVQREAGDLLSEDLHPFYRDLYDHIARNLDAVEVERDLLTNTLDVYLSSVANRTNEVMKVLTVLSTIALPCLLVSSIYGMNIKGIPFLDSPHAGWIVAGMMAGTTVVLLAFLRKAGWL